MSSGIRVCPEALRASGPGLGNCLPACLEGKMDVLELTFWEPKECLSFRLDTDLQGSG